MMMAYFGSNYYEAEPGVYLPTPYCGSHDFSLSCHSHNVLTPYSYTEFDQPSFFPYHPNPFVGAYHDHAPTRSVISYSVSTVSQSEVAVYDPATTYGGGYGDFKTRFTISYNEAGFNDTDFEDYDPTPYGGGYDPAQTYGEALPPSSEICYPRDAPPAIAPSLDPLPGGKSEADQESAPEPQKGSEQSKSIEEVQEQEKAQENGHGSNLEEPLGPSETVEIEGNYHDDYYPWTVYEYDKREGEKQAPAAPWGYNPEVMDFCESIFGYWPCLYKQRNHGRQGATYDEPNSNSNPWKGTEDFLFGSSHPYTNGGSHGDAFYGYERHYQEQPLSYLQVENEENSWVQKFNIF